MVVMGVDPGLATTGFAILESGSAGPRAVAIGTVRTARESSVPARLLELRDGLTALVSAHRPGSIAIERLFFTNNARTAMTVGQASGIAFLAAAEAGIEVFDYTPTEVKLAVAGIGNAPKGQVQAMVAALLGLSAAPKPADAADACAIALCHLQRAPLRAAVEVAG